jgi:hypothetical protein
VFFTLAPLNRGSFMKSSAFFKSFIAALMVLFAAAALALPTPKDIESAVSAGQLSHAESMLREVIQEKPQSAKAHYELGQVLARESRYNDAHLALKKAKELDPSLKFAGSPDKFNETYDKVNRMAQTSAAGSVSSPALNTPAPAVAAPAPKAPAAAEPAFSMTYVWLGIAGLVVLALFLRRNKPEPAAPMYSAAAPAGAGMGTPAAAAMAPRGFGSQFTPNAPMNNPSYPPGYGPYGQPTGGMGSGIGGAVVGGLAGVAAGYALSKALEGNHNSDHGNNAAANGSASNNGGYVPFDAPAQPDFGSFDAGSGSDWDDGSSGGGDDSW